MDIIGPLLLFTIDLVLYHLIVFTPYFVQTDTSHLVKTIHYLRFKLVGMVDL